jgi:hypothetical protein
MIDVDLSEVEDLVIDLGRVGSEIEPLVRAVTAKTLYDTEADGKNFAPVDTGALKNSIGFDLDPDGMGGEVGPTVEYAPYQEYGTSTQPGTPHMGPAFVKNVEPYVAALETVGGRVLE